MTAPCIWNSYQESILLSVLKKAKEAGQQAESGWKSGTFEKVVEALDGTEAQSGGSKKQLSQVKSRWHKFKSEYAIVKKLRNASGFGWDNERGLVTATQDVWDAYLAAHEKAKKFKTTPYPFYDDMAELVDGIIADGRGAFRPGRSKGGEKVQATVPSPSPAPANASTDAAAGTSGADAHNEGLESSSDASGSDTEDAPHKTVEVTGQQPLGTSKTPVTPASKKGRQSGAAAIFALSESIESIATSFNATAERPSSQTVLTSPQRRTHAIQTIEENEELSDEEMVNIADLIRKNTDIADTYLALKKPSLRSRYLRKHLGDLL